MRKYQVINVKQSFWENLRRELSTKREKLIPKSQGIIVACSRNKKNIVLLCVEYPFVF